MNRRRMLTLPAWLLAGEHLRPRRAVREHRRQRVGRSDHPPPLADPAPVPDDQEHPEFVRPDLHHQVVPGGL